MINEINSKFDEIIGLKFSTGIILPTNKLDWKFDLEKIIILSLVLELWKLKIILY